MTDQLLVTKLRPPPVRRDLVPRERLFAQLDQVRMRQVGLISAPAGFGKTTLVAAWASRCPNPIAWLSLDEADNDPVRWLAHVVGALQRIHPSVGQSTLAMLRAPQAPRWPALLLPLINDVDALDRSLILVLDDYHLIQAQGVHDALTFLLDHQPEKLHVLIATRADPPLPIARLRGRGQLVELRQADLRFTLPEADAFLRLAPVPPLTPANVEVLAERTEGWAAGLQMAAASLQNTADVEAFVRAFAGTQHHILDYLGEEVFNRQPPEVQRFLLRTCILDRLCASLSQAVMQDEAGQPEAGNGRGAEQQRPGAILEQLVQANLFITPLDEQHEWYRYHHLFADLLQRRLEQVWPEAVAGLHRRASLWHEQHGSLAEAARHALAAGEVDRVAHLAERDALAMFDRGELASLAGWLQAAPESFYARPWLCVARAWALVYAGPLEALEPVLEQAERGLPGLEPEAQRRVAGHLAAVRAYAGWLRGEGTRSASQAREALARLTERDVLARALAATALGAALCDAGDLTGSVRASQQSISISRVVRATHVTQLAAANLAYAQQLQGHLRAAAVTCRHALADVQPEQAEQLMPATGTVSAVLSLVLLEWNDLAGAESCARRGQRLGQHWGHKDTIAIASVYLANCLAAAGNAAGALEALDQATEAAKDLSRWYCHITEAAEARLRLTLGDVEAASRWAQASQMQPGDTFPFQQWTLYRTLAQVLSAQGRPAEALQLLARLLALAEGSGAHGLLVQFGVLQALALQAQGRLTEAVAALERPLALGEPEGYVRSFVAGGPPAAKLLRAAFDRGLAPKYVSGLLAACSPDDHRAAPGGTAAEAGTLPEPLTERERDILRLIAEGCSNHEIGSRLYLAPGTVKSYTYSLYGKLGVHSRTQAVARARSFGLLPEA